LALNKLNLAAYNSANNYTHWQHDEISHHNNWNDKFNQPRSLVSSQIMLIYAHITRLYNKSQPPQITANQHKLFTSKK